MTYEGMRSRNGCASGPIRSLADPTAFRASRPGTTGRNVAAWSTQTGVPGRRCAVDSVLVCERPIEIAASPGSLATAESLFAAIALTATPRQMSTPISSRWPRIVFAHHCIRCAHAFV